MRGVIRPGRRRRLAALAALVCIVSVTSCDFGGTPSALAPDQVVEVGGKLVGPDGKAVGLTRVVFYREPNAGEILGDLFFITASLGLACLADNGPVTCRDSRKTTTGPDGKFSFKMKGRDTYETFLTVGTTTNAGTFNLAAALPAGRDEATGPATTQSFKVQVPNLQLPDVKFWRPGMKYEGNQGADPHLSWDVVPGDFGDNPKYEADFEDRAGNVVWDFANVQPGASFDRRLLEDHTGSVAVHARSNAQGSGTKIGFDYRSQGIAFTGTGGKPLSRQRSCFAYGADGKPVRQTACRLTDGDVGRVYQPHTDPVPCPSRAPGAPPPTACGEPQHGSNYIDLGAPARIDLVVVHGCTHTCLIETSLDGQRWALVGGRHQGDNQSADNGLSAFPLSGNVTARYVRVTMEDNDISRLTEVSVWGPGQQNLPPPPEAPLPAPQGSSLGGNHTAPGGLSPLQIAGLVAVNIVGLAVVALVVVLLLRRRRRAAAVATPDDPASG